MSQSIYLPFQPTLTAVALRQSQIRLQVSSASPDLNTIVFRFIKISATRACAYRVIPDASYALYFSPHCALFSVGLKRPQILQLSANTDYYGIHFYPGVLPWLFRRDYSEVGGVVTQAQFLPLEFVDQLQEIFYARASFQAKIARCEGLMRRLVSVQAMSTRPSQAMQTALALLYHRGGNVRIQSLAKATAYSERQLNRVFQQTTGLNGKTFADIIRLQSVLRHSEVVDSVSLRRVLDHGYYDQSHFYKDYRRFMHA